MRGLRRLAPLSPLSTALGAAGSIVLADQLTKWWVVSWLRIHPIDLFGGVLELHYVTNSGAAFSMLQGAGSLIALAAVALAVFIFLVVRKVENRVEALALGLVLGGALGNLADRFFRGPGLLDGRVVDWVDFSFFPAFNVADSAITIGAAMALIVAFRRE
ncbi:MAG: signal peptidase II [Actinobacteria bacterium RBG_16_68_21]|nr:MAG: signal peptidase II [Actinobacteria bacterium RBG_16_68_21]